MLFALISVLNGNWDFHDAYIPLGFFLVLATIGGLLDAALSHAPASFRMLLTSISGGAVYVGMMAIAGDTLDCDAGRHNHLRGLHGLLFMAVRWITWTRRCVSHNCRTPGQGSETMRAPAIIATLSGIATLFSVYCFLLTSSGLEKAARIRARPNGDVVWLDHWQSNRTISLGCAICFLLLFVWAIVALYKAQRDEIQG